MLVGCAMSKEMYLPDGSRGYNISCDGSANSMGTAFRRPGSSVAQRATIYLTAKAKPFQSVHMLDRRVSVLVVTRQVTSRKLV